jgi:predicted nucleic acid-binding protein
MNIAIVVDANVILSALIGGKSGLILFDSRFEFVTTDFTIEEVKKYLPKLALKLDIPEKTKK